MIELLRFMQKPSLYLFYLAAHPPFVHRTFFAGGFIIPTFAV